MRLEGRITRLERAVHDADACPGCGRRRGAVHSIVIVDPIRGEPPYPDAARCSVCGAVRGSRIQIIEWPATESEGRDNGAKS